MANDVIDDLLKRLATHIPSAADLAPKLEAEMRQAWGGTEPYIRHKPDPSRRTMALAEALRQGKPLKEAFAMAGLPRRSGFRHLNKRSP